MKKKYKTGSWYLVEFRDEASRSRMLAHLIAQPMSRCVQPPVDPDLLSPCLKDQKDWERWAFIFTQLLSLFSCADRGVPCLGEWLSFLYEKDRECFAWLKVTARPD